ncbi:PREDICTED: uncharacterized protein LOC108567962 [Nicrophorus vespilloides]|uniref:Uncharacterized protein LOC108567962 n=1 Tax=Nicrophorus vespilloides TaxID=110193 RepID=A0ABM1NBT4_NICVS|nr:PREDICTED: uncharacterized protein LOC108567962 [Nicrophorus vespilloides]XP_017784284.1 PREDICTED: uncharacterized protein LOC108567962 [Nicrophorus vespilloides]
MWRVCPMFSGKYMDFDMIRRQLAEVKSIPIRDAVQRVIDVPKCHKPNVEHLVMLNESIKSLYEEIRLIITEEWETIMIHLITCKMEETVRHSFLDDSTLYPTMNAAMKALQSRVDCVKESSKKS